MSGLLKVDYHIHSSFSDGEADYRQIIERAKAIGLDGIAITDHFDKFDENKRTSSITDDELLEHFEKIREYGNKTGQKVLCGIETCTDFQGNIRVSDRVINCCDIIITSPHYVEYEGDLIPGNYYNDRFWYSYKQKVLNIAAGPGDILGHSESYLPFDKLLVPGATTFEERKAISRDIASRYFNDEYIDELIAALKKSGKALELHCITSSPRESVIKKMIENKVTISLGSDSHTLSWTGCVGWGLGMLEKYGGQDLLFIR